MGLTDLLGRLASRAPVPVYAIAGAGAREAIQDLRLHQELRLVDAPGAASILVIGGRLPESVAGSVRRLHDSLAHPRATVLWSIDGHAYTRLDGARDPIFVQDHPVATIVTTYRELVAGKRPSEPAALPDVDPAQWRGVGPYGQGGSGMTGGTPYGRPMAELGPDPDGLRLDVLPVEVGPFFSRFPPGLVLDVRFAGDLVLEASLRDLTGGGMFAPRPTLEPFLRAITGPVSIAEVELARARSHLRWVADALHAQGLPALGRRALRCALAVTPGGSSMINDLRRLIERSQVLRWSVRGVGRIRPDVVRGLGGGPIARAAGVPEDVRLEDSAYLAIGFRPLVSDAGDAAARWRIRLDEAAQSIELAARAGTARTSVLGRVESPRGRLEAGSGPSERVFGIVPDLLREREWGDVVATVVSLDLDLEESAHVRQAIPAVALA